jgi:hypothetical protein
MINSVQAIIIRRKKQVRFAHMRYWRKKAAEFVGKGLTTRGTVRQYELHPFYQIHGRRRNNLRQKLYRSRIYENGFTTRGGSRWSPLERAWRELKNTMLHETDAKLTHPAGDDAGKQNQ